MISWSRLPDVSAVSLLAFAFASVLRSNRAPGVNLWLIAWLLILAHFVGAMFAGVAGGPGVFFTVMEGAGLVVPAVIFMWSTVPTRHRFSSRAMLAVLLGTNLLCLEIATFGTSSLWLMDGTAVLLGLSPLFVFLCAAERHSGQLIVVVSNLALGVFLLVTEHRGALGFELAQNAILTTLYLAATLHFWWKYGFRTAGSSITVSGFIAWFMVFPVGMAFEQYAPGIQIESEIWNLPKYVVAAGMLLLLLEDQIERTRHLALHDVLTGLPNRRFFLDSLDRGIAQAQRTQSRLALLSLDLNDFKRVNDTLGHHVGDELLCKVAGTLSSRIRKSDVFARTGGDEFTIIVQEPVLRESAEALASQLAELLRKPITVSDHAVQIGASIGVALFPDDAAEAGDLCILADQRMYQTKGRSQPYYQKPVASQRMQVAGTCLDI